MARPRSSDTKDRILHVAADLLRSGGPNALTFDAVASRLGVTKQAVLYWFPSKVALFTELAVPELRREAHTARDAVAGAADAGDAARRVVRALIGFHLADLARFRLMYLAFQIGPDGDARRTAAQMAAEVHPVTSDMYGAVAEALGGGGDARETAVALHMAALGHVLMVALTDAIQDPLRHAPEALAGRLAAVLAAGIAQEAHDAKAPAGAPER